MYNMRSGPEYYYWRQPTEAEIKFGHAVEHYCYFIHDVCCKKDGTPKKWFKSNVTGGRWNLVKGH